MLQADDVHVAMVEKVRSAEVGRQVLLFNFAANHFRIFVPALNVVNRHGEAPAIGMSSRNRGEQIRRKSSDATLARQVVTGKRNVADFR